MHGTTHSYVVDLGQAIRARRLELDLTQEDVAGRAKIAANYFGRVERGEAAVTVPRLVRIGKALETSASQLLASSGM